jgi:RES domain-containing protein
MLTAWRIVREKHVETAFSGEGAAEYGGRWNLPGTRVAYTSQSRSLAALELLVHLNPPFSFKYKAIQIEFDESMAETLPPEEWPADWKAEPPSLLTQKLGSRWAEESRSAILAVPSAIIEEEINYVVNPLHRYFSRIRIGAARDFGIDPRLLGS